MDVFDKLHNMSVNDRIEYSSKLAEKYGYEFNSDVSDSDDTKEIIGKLAWQLSEDDEPLTLEDAQDILFFCLFEEVGNDAGHVLADRVLVRIIDKEFGDKAHQLITMWFNVSKWYA